MLVFGFDPGEVSGIVLTFVEERRVRHVLEWSELRQRAAVDKAAELSGIANVVVCERWVPRGGALSFKPYSLELIGWARGLCWQRNIPFVLQPAAMKNQFHTAALEQFPAVGRGSKGGHARDALAHVIGWAKTRRMG